MREHSSELGDSKAELLDGHRRIGPQHPLKILLLAGAILTALAWAVPSGELRFGQDFALAIPALTPGGKAKYADIRHILEAHRDDIDAPSPEQVSEGDKSPSGGPGESFTPEIKNIDSLTATLEPIENPSALSLFFDSIRQREQLEKVVRVLHFGDSQIEGDRISDFVREHYQQEFGGCGVGLIPPYEPWPSRASVLQENEGVWARYVPYGKRDPPAPHNRFGIMAALYRYGEAGPEQGETPAAEDSIGPPPTVDEQKEILKAALIVKRSPIAYPQARRFETVTLLAGRMESAVRLTLANDAGEEFEEYLAPGEHLRVASWRFESPFRQMRMDFESDLSPDLYALALDCPRGVAVDNIPLRGSSGVFAHRMDLESFGQQLRQLNVRLIIWQFGPNVIPYLQDNYRLYETQTRRSLRSLKQAFPEIAILVVGVADMSVKEGEVYRSYPNLEGVRGAQRRAALAEGCAFWDLLEAMGGVNSMPSWVLHDPPLATSDFTHFNYRGARVVARMLYNALRQAQNSTQGDHTKESDHGPDSTQDPKS